MNDLQHTGIAARLRALTPARVGLARSGTSQVTRDVLDFQLCHAQARDAVHSQLDPAALAGVFAEFEGAHTHGPTLLLKSAATDRAVYLQRPDLGRRLSDTSRDFCAQAKGGDLAFIVCDGLSAIAVERHVPPLLKELLPRLSPWQIAPLCIAEQGRVAIGDEIGSALHVRLAVVLIGERPGLSSPDSLGAYITWAPQLGRTDAERVCISNIRPQGLNYPEAAEQLERVITESFERRATGVALPPASRELMER